MTTAQRADATAEPVSFVFDGDTYTVPPAAEWDLDVLEAVEGQQFTVAAKRLLGDKQYATFRKTHAKVADLNGLFDALGEATLAGNS